MTRFDVATDLINAERRFLVCQFDDHIESGSLITCNIESLIDFIER